MYINNYICTFRQANNEIFILIDILNFGFISLINCNHHFSLYTHIQIFSTHCACTKETRRGSTSIGATYRACRRAGRAGDVRALIARHHRHHTSAHISISKRHIPTYKIFFKLLSFFITDKV